MRRFALLIFLMFPLLARAETMEINPDDPVAEFKIPDDWKTSRIERGIQAISKDEEVYFWIEAYKPDEFDKIIAEHNAFWKDHDVVISSSDEEKHDENGRQVSVTTEHATWKGAPTVLYYVEFHLGLASQSNIVFTYWASPGGDKAFQKEVGDALGSLTVTEK